MNVLLLCTESRQGVSVNWVGEAAPARPWAGPESRAKTQKVDGRGGSQERGEAEIREETGMHLETTARALSLSLRNGKPLKVRFAFSTHPIGYWEEDGLETVLHWIKTYFWMQF